MIVSTTLRQTCVMTVNNESDTYWKQVCGSADWTGWSDVNPISSYNPIVNTIDQLFTIVSSVLGQTHAPDWTDWSGVDPISSYNQFLNYIDQLFTIVSSMLGLTHAAD